MIQQKRFIAALLSMLLSLSLSACGSSGAPANSNSSGSTVGTDTAADGEIITLSIMHKLFGDERYLGDDNINNNVWTREYVKQTGFQLNYVIAASQDDYNQKLTMAIASNDLPDLLELPAKEFTMLAQAGKLADLTQAYEDHASDLLKEAITADGGIQLASGKIGDTLYGVPQPNAADASVDLIWVRTDWMENLGLESPQTIDDVVEIARAFKNNDPDGNGQADTIGIAFQKKMVEEEGAQSGSFEGFFAGYDAYSRAWLKEEDGSIGYGGIRLGMKDALAKLNEMYAEGLIDPEFGVKDYVKVNEDIASGKVGLLYGREGLPWGPLKDCIVNNPQADWTSYPIVPATADGKAAAMTYVLLDRYFAVNASCPYPEALFQIANVFQEKINSIDSSLETLNEFGVDPDTGINLAACAAFGMDPSVQKCNTYYKEIKDVFEGIAEVDDIHPEAIRYYTTMKEYVDSRDKAAYPVGWNYYKFIGPEGAWHTINTQYKDQNLLDESVWFGAPTKTMSTKRASLEKLQSETYVNIITGSQPVDTFDKFVDDWKSMGGDEITAEVNDWYHETFA